MEEMNYPWLKTTNAQTLLKAYLDYHRFIANYIQLRDTYKRGSDDYNYYQEKIDDYSEYLFALEHEILKRMSGLEID